MMNLEDIRNDWDRYDSGLKEQLEIDEKLFRNDHFLISEDELSRPLIHEVVNIVVVSIVSIIILGCSIVYFADLKFSLPGILGGLLGLYYVYLAGLKIKHIQGIDFFNTPIVSLQKSLAQLQLEVIKWRKIEMALFPFFIILILPVVFRTIQGRDLYHDVQFYILEAGFIIGFSLIGMFVINKYLYEDRINTISLFLKEMDEI